MALVVILSVFNGFHDLVASLFTNFDPQIQVVPAVGKTIPADAISIDKIKKMPQVAVATECVEDMALAVYRDKQLMVRVKGVQDNFPELTNIQKICMEKAALKRMQAFYNTVYLEWERRKV